jgi:tRNA nucleotidyltransferase (CCA-adding enzyme)
MHDIGKGVTPPEIWPSHRGHEAAGDELFKLLAQRLRIPERFQRLASKVIRYHTHCHHAMELKPSTLVDTLQNLDAFRKNNELELFLLSCLADARGRTGFEECDYPQADLFRQAQQAALSVDVKAVVALGLKGAAIGEELRKRRIAKVRSILPDFKVAHA